MNTFVNAVANQEARTANGMKARASTANACVDLFYNIGASRGKNIVPAFVAAYVENREIALRIAQWSRDIRGGAGERQLYRDIMRYLEINSPADAKVLASKVQTVGRFDDLLGFSTKEVQEFAFSILKRELLAGNALAAKWCPRKGAVANALRAYLGWSPKFYRKTLVGLTQVVETQMCAKQWDEINFSHVPSVAHARYKTAFNRNTTKYADYVAALVKGDDPSVKVNASAIYPYEVIKGLCNSYARVSMGKTELDLVAKQWEALPNYVGDASILPMVDVSGSMECSAGGSSTTCMDIAISLGLYLADKNKGVFKDTFLTFSSKPELITLKGNIVQKLQTMSSSSWGMSTNLHAAMQKILDVAVKGNVSQEQMPKTLLILSDMQFDRCVSYDDSAVQMVQRKFEVAGYEVPQIVFWNLNASGNAPVAFDSKGAALVSGFSPAIMTAILANDTDQFSPESIMLKAVMLERYDV